MTAMFDAPKFARALRDGGQSTPEQSERLSDAHSEAISGEAAARADSVATESKPGRRTDELEGKPGRGFQEARADLGTEVRGVEAEIEAAKVATLKCIVGIVGFQSVAIIGAAIVLARILAR